MELFYLWLKAVLRHWRRELLGGFLIGLLALVSELTGLTVPRRIYEICAILVLFYAMFLAWRDIKKELDELREGNAKLEGGVLSDYLKGQEQREYTYALHEHARALEKEERNRHTQSIIAAASKTGPLAKVTVNCSSERASLTVLNEGTSVEFYAVFSISGAVNTTQPDNLSAKWSHTNSAKVKIVKGQRCLIALANLITSDTLSTWQIHALMESKTGNMQPVEIIAAHSSSQHTEPMAIAGDIRITGHVIADPHLLNGIQPFEVVLQAFTARKVTEAGL